MNTMTVTCYGDPGSFVMEVQKNPQLAIDLARGLEEAIYDIQHLINHCHAEVESSAEDYTKELRRVLYRVKCFYGDYPKPKGTREDGRCGECGRYRGGP